MAGRLELVQQTGIAFGRLVDRERPLGLRPWTQYGGCGRRGCDINADEKRIRLCCLVCLHSNLHSLQAFPCLSLGWLTPVGCQRSSARDAWSKPQDTVQSSDNLESWGTLFAPRSEPLLSCGPHHDPGTMLIIRAVIAPRPTVPWEAGCLPSLHAAEKGFVGQVHTFLSVLQHLAMDLGQRRTFTLP